MFNAAAFLAGCDNLAVFFVFQAFHLIPTITAVENVAVPLGTLDKILKNKLREMADERPSV